MMLAKAKISSYNNGVQIISDETNTIIATIPSSANFEPSCLAYDSGKGEIFAVNSGSSGMISIISDATNSVVKTFSVGGFPSDLVYDSGKGEIFVLNEDVIQVVSDKNNAVIADLNLSSQGLVYDSGRGEIFTMGANNGILYAISDVNNNVVESLTVGAYLPFGLTYDSGKGEILLVGFGTITVISDAPSSNTAPVPTSALPTSTTPSPPPQSQQQPLR